MVVKDIFGVLIAIVVLAGLSVAILNGKDTANVLNAAGSSFSNVIKAAAYGR